ncbi:MAG: PAS domain-containing protein [Bdellovibrionales bacterium]
MNSQLNTLVENLDDKDFAISIAKVVGDNRDLIYVNKKFLSVTGFSKDEVLGKNCKFLQGEITNSDTVNYLRNAINNRKSIARDILNYSKDGELFINRLILIYFPLDGEDYYVGLQTNVSNDNSEKLRDVLSQLSSEEIENRLKEHLMVTLDSDPKARAQLDEIQNLKEIQHLYRSIDSLRRYAINLEETPMIDKWAM